MCERTKRQFADDLPRLLAARGLSLRGLAKGANVSPAHLARADPKSPKRASEDLVVRVAHGLHAFDLGRFPEAYRHLRHYTEIAPHGSWNWCWFGKAAEAIGEKDEAARAYERALELEADGDEQTEATEQLKALVGFESMSAIRQRLNERTGGRVGLYSTAEHYSGGPGAKVLRYYQYDKQSSLTCAACGWSGKGEDGDENTFEELFDVRCPRCDNMLVVVSWLTLEETREEAGRGHPGALRDLAAYEDAKEQRG